MAKQLRNPIFSIHRQQELAKKSAFDLFLKSFLPSLKFIFIAFILDFKSCISAFFSFLLSTFCPAKINLSRNELLFKNFASRDENYDEAI